MRKSLVAILSSLAICVASSGAYAGSNSSKSGSNTEPAQIYHKSERHANWCKSHPGAKSCHKHRRHHRHHYGYRDGYREGYREGYYRDGYNRDGVRRENGMMEYREDRNLEDHR